MKKTLQQKIEEAYEELKDIALELVDDLDISDDLGDNYACFVDKELYSVFQKVSAKITKLHEKQKAEDSKQLKLALKR